MIKTISLRSRFLTTAAAALLAALTAANADAQEAARIDYLTFAQGATVASLGGDAEALRVGFGDALEIIDGNPGGVALTGKPATVESVVEVVYRLPSATTFDRFAVPRVLETPSPSQTFVRSVEVLGAAEGREGPFVRLASGELKTHSAAGQVSELTVHASPAVRWLKLRLSGGIDVRTETFFLEFSELIGNGEQQPVALAEGFSGIWKQGANVLELYQEGATVVGCYDRGGELSGTVSGNVLRATGADSQSGVPSAFVLMLDADGGIQGVRSTNGAPFAHYVLPTAPDGVKPRCAPREPARLGCGAIVHGIRFAFDSAAIRPESEPVLADLFVGLQAEKAVSIVVEGHTSSEGTEAYNQKLSERRAQAVVDDLVRRGIAGERLSAAGLGEAQPIASNDDEAGRSLNRRVEIRCSDG